MAKRKRVRDSNVEEDTTATPKKSRSVLPEPAVEDKVTIASPAAETPSGRKRGRPPGSASKGTPKSALKAARTTSPSISTPRSERRVLFSKPKESSDEVTPRAQANGTKSPSKAADRSAQKKIARRLIQQTVSDDISDEEDLAQEELLARQIRGEDEDGEEDGDEEDDNGGEALKALKELGQDQDVGPGTPSKRGRGRPKGSRKKRSPTPPTNLPPHEQYFFQNRPGGTKTSNNTLPSASLLDHEEYFAQLRNYIDPHEPDTEFLHSLHTRSFARWAFELSEGFNLCLHGWGSKRNLALEFAQHLQQNPPTLTSTAPKVVVINGYNTSLTLRDILQSIASVIPSLAITKLPSQPAALQSLLLAHLSLPRSPPSSLPILLINSVDAPPMRRSTIQSAIASLVATQRLSLITTADTPTFSLLWDHSTLSRLHLVFHDATTYASFDKELDAVSEVQNLLGRGGRRGLGGRAGVGFVLRSLTENARGLFKILVKEQLISMVGEEEEGDAAETRMQFDTIGGPDGDSLFSSPSNLSSTKKKKQDASVIDITTDGGVEYRVLYHKAVEEFICSSEHAFRTLLKEFHDHQMVESRKDSMGIEILSVPFRRGELEGLLEEIAA